MIAEDYKRGRVLLYDEIEASFHPHAVDLIIKLFQDPQVNRHSAQLIFTTHNPNNMNSDVFRKDQIWLVEKLNGASALTSLDQFDNLSDTNPFDKWYYEGRLGGIPKTSVDCCG